MERKRLLSEIQRRPVTFVPGKKVLSMLPGEWTSTYAGKGYEPLGYRDFQLGDDPRRINIPATARRGVQTMIERVALRDFKVMVVVDGSSSMRVREKQDIQIGAVALLLYSAWQAETTFGFGVRTTEGVRSFGMGIGSRHFYHLYHSLLQLFYGKEGAPTKGTRVHLSRCLPPNAMLLYCSDFLESEGELVDLGPLWRSVRRYDFIPIIIQDELEYTFPVFSKASFVPLANPETGKSEEIWISPKTARAIRARHEARFQELVAMLHGRGINSLHLDTPDVEFISRRISRYFHERKGRFAA